MEEGLAATVHCKFLWKALIRNTSTCVLLLCKHAVAHLLVLCQKRIVWNLNQFSHKLNKSESGSCLKRIVCPRLPPWLCHPVRTIRLQPPLQLLDYLRFCYTSLGTKGRGPCASSAELFWVADILQATWSSRATEVSSSKSSHHLGTPSNVPLLAGSPKSKLSPNP